jgi:hypothetical protein
MAPKAPTKRKISWALQRACAAVKMGMRRSGVPTNRTKSRQRSRIHGEGAGGVAEEAGCLLWLEGDFAKETACVAMAFDNSNQMLWQAFAEAGLGTSKRRVAFLPPA